jgi:hypothetical protein
MNDEVNVKMLVKLVDGTQERYSFGRQMTDDDTHLLMKKIQELLEAKHLIIDLGSKIQIIPMDNILTIELEPAPLTLPSNCIRGASLV